MEAIACGAARGSARTANKTGESARRRPGWLMRFIAILHGTRRMQAEREIRKHAHLMPRTLDEDD